MYKMLPEYFILFFALIKLTFTIKYYTIKSSASEYKGYISENIITTVSINNKHIKENSKYTFIQNVNVSFDNRESNSYHDYNDDNSNIYVRFIDYHKPTIYIESFREQNSSQSTNKSQKFYTNIKNSSNLCSAFKTKFYFKIEYGNEDDYFDDPFIGDDMYVSEYNSNYVVKCFINLKLKPNRDQLNREAKGEYKLNIKINEYKTVENNNNSSSFSSKQYSRVDSLSDEFFILNLENDSSCFNISVIVLDDNDNEPLYDQYEYSFEMSDLDYLAANTVIGTIMARDADVGRNAEILYYMDNIINHSISSLSTPTSLKSLFDCIITTGEIYVKYDSRYIFKNHYNLIDELNHIKFDIKAIDNGPKLDFYNYLTQIESSKISTDSIISLLALETISANSTGNFNNTKNDRASRDIENIYNKFFQKQYVDTTTVRISFNLNGINLIKTKFRIEEIDHPKDESYNFNVVTYVILKLDNNIEKMNFSYFESNFKLILNQNNNFADEVKLYINRLDNELINSGFTNYIGSNWRIYIIKYDLLDARITNLKNFNFNYSIDVCLIKNLVCIKKAILSFDLLKIYNEKCKLEIHVNSNIYYSLENQINNESNIDNDSQMYKLNIIDYFDGFEKNKIYLLKFYYDYNSKYFLYGDKIKRYETNEYLSYMYLTDNLCKLVQNNVKFQLKLNTINGSNFKNSEYNATIDENSNQLIISIDSHKINNRYFENEGDLFMRLNTKLIDKINKYSIKTTFINVHIRKLDVGYKFLNLDNYNDNFLYKYINIHVQYGYLTRNQIIYDLKNDSIKYCKIVSQLEEIENSKYKHADMFVFDNDYFQLKLVNDLVYKIYDFVDNKVFRYNVTIVCIQKTLNHLSLSKSLTFYLNIKFYTSKIENNNYSVKRGNSYYYNLLLPYTENQIYRINNVNNSQTKIKINIQFLSNYLYNENSYEYNNNDSLINILKKYYIVSYQLMELFDNFIGDNLEPYEQPNKSNNKDNKNSIPFSFDINTFNLHHLINSSSAIHDYQLKLIIVFRSKLFTYLRVKLQLHIIYNTYESCNDFSDSIIDSYKPVIYGKNNGKTLSCINLITNAVSDNNALNNYKCEIIHFNLFNFLINMPKWSSYLLLYSRMNIFGKLRLKNKLTQKYLADEKNLEYEYVESSITLSNVVLNKRLKKLFNINKFNGNIYLNDDNENLYLLKFFYFLKQKIQSNETFRNSFIQLVVKITQNKSNITNDYKLCKLRLKLFNNYTNDLRVLKFTGNRIKFSNIFYTNNNNLLNLLNKGNEYVVKVVNVYDDIDKNSIIFNVRKYLKRNFNYKKYEYLKYLIDDSLKYELIDSRDIEISKEPFDKVDTDFFQFDNETTNLYNKFRLNARVKDKYYIKIKLTQFLHTYDIDAYQTEFVYCIDLIISIKHKLLDGKDIIKHTSSHLLNILPIYYKFIYLNETDSYKDGIQLFNLSDITLSLDWKHDEKIKFSLLNSNTKYLNKFKLVNDVIKIYDVPYLMFNKIYSLSLKLLLFNNRIYNCEANFSLVLYLLKKNGTNENEGMYSTSQSNLHEIVLDNFNYENRNYNSVNDEEKYETISTKPIVNDINLNIYDFIYDTSKPLAQIIIFNLDLKSSTYLFQLIRVNVHYNEQPRKQNQPFLNRSYLNQLFYIDNLNGYLYIKQNNLPCFNCSFIITYRVNKTTYLNETSVGKESSFYTDDDNNKDYISDDSSNYKNYRVVTRRGFIKMNVLRLEETMIGLLPIKTINSIHMQNNIENDSQKEFNKMDDKIIVKLNKNCKLGEKIVDIKVFLNDTVFFSDTRYKNINNNKIINFLLLNNQVLDQQIFYLSNNDGSLYIIKNINYNSTILDHYVFNLTIQITNLLGQYELRNLYIYMNNRKAFFYDYRKPPRNYNVYLQNFEVNLTVDSSIYEKNENAFHPMQLQRAIDTKILYSKFDYLDEINLCYKIENCFYLTNKIHFSEKATEVNSRLCNLKSGIFQLDESNANLELKSNSLLVYLYQNSDILIPYYKKNDLDIKSIKFVIDYSVAYNKSYNYDTTRIFVNVNFNLKPQNSELFMNNEIDWNSNDFILFKFKNNSYFLDKTIGSTSVDYFYFTELINLYNELILIINNQTSQYINPFDLRFSLKLDENIQENENFLFANISIDNNYGILTFSKWKSNEHLPLLDFNLYIICKYTYSYKEFLTNTSVYVKLKIQHSEDAASWKMKSIDTYTFINSPTNTFLRLINTSNILKLTDFITFKDESSHNEFIFNIYSINGDEADFNLFYLDPFIGTVRITKEFLIRYGKHNIYNNTNERSLKCRLLISLCKLNEFCCYKKNNAIMSVNVHIIDNNHQNLKRFSLIALNGYERVNDKEKIFNINHLLPHLDLFQIDHIYEDTFLNIAPEKVGTYIKFYRDEITKKYYRAVTFYLTLEGYFYLKEVNGRFENVSINYLNENIFNVTLHFPKRSNNFDDFELIDNATKLIKYGHHNDSKKLSRLLIYEFNVTAMYDLLNFKEFFYVEANQLFLSKDIFSSNTFELYLRDKKKTNNVRKLILNILNIDAIKPVFYIIDHFGKLVNLDVFLMKLNITVFLNRLFESNQTQPLYILKANAKFKHILNGGNCNNNIEFKIINISYVLWPTANERAYDFINDRTQLNYSLDSLFLLNSCNGYLYVNKKYLNDNNHYFLRDVIQFRNFILNVQASNGYIQSDILQLNINLISESNNNIKLLPLFKDDYFIHNLNYSYISKINSSNELFIYKFDAFFLKTQSHQNNYNHMYTSKSQYYNDNSSIYYELVETNDVYNYFYLDYVQGKFLSIQSCKYSK